jgi:glycosyltransferase involved in cell wall biosynthesis
VVRNLPLTRLFKDSEPHPDLNVDGFKLVYAGLILPERGINVLLEALQLLHRQGIEDVHLFLIGPDTSLDYMHEIESFAQDHELANQVHLMGYVFHDQIKHYLANANVGLLPGLPTRQFRNPAIATKLLEYMLCALPVLSVDHAHHRVFIEEADCGLLVPFADSSAHAEAILWLRDNPDEAEAMGQRGRRLILEKYTWEMEQSRLLDFYRDLLAGEREFDES